MNSSAAAPLIEKPKWSSPITHSPTTRSPFAKRVTASPTAIDLARPFVAGNQRVVEGDDVATFEQLDVGVAHAHRPCRDQNLITRDLRRGQLIDLRGSLGDESQCLHVLSPRTGMVTTGRGRAP